MNCCAPILSHWKLALPYARLFSKLDSVFETPLHTRIPEQCNLCFSSRWKPCSGLAPDLHASSAVKHPLTALEKCQKSRVFQSHTDQQVKTNQNHYISEAPIRNKHVFAAFMSFLTTANLIKNNIKGHFCEQMGKPRTCRLTHPSTLNRRSHPSNSASAQLPTLQK